MISRAAFPLLLAMLAQPGAAQELPTTMAERQATVDLLDKVSGETRSYEVNPGDRINYRSLTIRVMACESTPPWAERQQQGAFLQIEQRRRGGDPARLFSGWLFAESPSLNSFDHPGYDVWVRSCTMSFPETGEDTIVVN